MYTCTVSDEIGCHRLVEKKRLLSAVKRSGAVSPAMRASASTMPVMMPGSAAGSTTLNTARARVAPSASAPSRIVPGTSSSSSSVVRAMIGIIITPSAMAPAIALNCLNGSTAMPYTNTPMTIDGTPFSVSAAKRMREASRVPAYSDMYTPLTTPIGMAITDPRPARIRVPTIEFASPPPVSPTGFGILVKKSRLTARMP